MVGVTPGDEADHIKPRNSYVRNGWDWPSGDEDDIAEPVSDRLAVLPDGIFLRLNPPEQPRVDDVIQPGSLISTNYGEQVHKVFRIRECEVYGLPTFTIAIGDVDTPAREDGLPQNYGGGNIKELVYQDGAVRKLFWNNDDVVHVHGHGPIDVDYQAGLTGWSDD